MSGERRVQRGELNAVINSVLALPDIAKFEVFKALQEDLSATVLEDPKTRLVEQRKMTLEAMLKVSEHLGLEEGKPPTTKQFDAAAKELGLPLSRSVVVRAWGTWRAAAEAYQGQRKPGVKAQRPFGRRIKKKGQASEYLDDVQAWLAQDPEQLSRDAYEKFARAHNETTPFGSGLSSAKTIQDNLGIRWIRVVDVAQGRQSYEKAVEQELAETLPAKTKDALVGISVIARLLAIPHSRVSDRANKQASFPVPVAHIRGQRAWLYEDIKLYKRGLSAPQRTEDEYQARYMDSLEIAEVCEISRADLSRYLFLKRWGSIPKPEGAVARGTHYWKRSSVEAWLKQMREQ